MNGIVLRMGADLIRMPIADIEVEMHMILAVVMNRITHSFHSTFGHRHDLGKIGLGIGSGQNMAIINFDGPIAQFETERPAGQ
jgi:hypothetical protein